MLVGEIQPDRGRFDIGETVKFGYYSQDGLHFNEQMKVIDAVRDIVTLNVLEDYLRNFKGCLIVISHDRYFMDKVVDHLLVFKGNGELKDFPGNYTDYREWKETQEQKAKSEQAEKAKQDNKKTTAEKRNTSDNTRRRLSFKEKKELEQLEMEITLQSKRLPGINENLDEKTLRWLELSEIEG